MREALPTGLFLQAGRWLVCKCIKTGIHQIRITAENTKHHEKGENLILI